MTKLLLVGIVVLFAASAAHASYTVSYGWEDGIGTVLGTYGTNISNIANVSGPIVGQACTLGTYNCPGAFEGTQYLMASETPHTGTPQLFLACITGLVEGDIVPASFWGYDATPGASPSLRIWGHYSSAVQCPDCPGDYTGSAGGNAAYTDGPGWDEVAFDFPFTSSGDDFGLVIEARLYSSPSTLDPCQTDYFVDFVTVTVPDYAHVLFPDLEGPSATEAANWGAIKALFQ